jgi:FKBP-type peptidyl-prolyl cis-trans isomerase
VTRNFLVLFFVLLGVGCTPQCEKNNFEPEKPIGNPLPEFKIEELSAGVGPKLRDGDFIKVQFRAWIYDNAQSDKKGAIVQDTYRLNSPQKLQFGRDEVILGWQEGLSGMRLNGKRRLFIPSTMAYGDDGAGNQIPKGVHLIYEVEIVEVDQSEGKPSSINPPSSSETNGK